MSILIQTQAIVLKSSKYGESSIISQVLSKDHGLISVIMSNVTNNAKKSMWQLMNQLDLVIYFNEHKDVHRVKEARYAKVYQSLPFEIPRSANGIFILELLRKTMRPHEKDIELYEWVKNCLDICDVENKLSHMPLYFLIGLSRYIGICPLNNHDNMPKVFDMREGCFVMNYPFHREYIDHETSVILSKLIDCIEFADALQIPMNYVLRKKLFHAMLDYFKIHIEHFDGVDSPQILEEILAA